MSIIGIDLAVGLLLLVVGDESCLFFLPGFAFGTLSGATDLGLSACFLIYFLQITAAIVGIIEVLIVGLR